MPEARESEASFLITVAAVTDVITSLNNFDLEKEDDNYGIKIYCEAVPLANAFFSGPSN
jgi:hypothetical protein